MAIEFICAGCKGHFRVPDSFAGKKLRCKKCGHISIAPQAAAAANRQSPPAHETGIVPPAPAAFQPPVAKRPPAAATVEDTPLHFQDEEPAAPPPADPAALDMDLICLGESKMPKTPATPAASKTGPAQASTAVLPPDTPIEEPVLESTSGSDDMAAAAQVQAMVVSADPMAVKAAAAPPVERGGRWISILQRATAPILVGAVALLHIAMGIMGQIPMYRAGHATLGTIAWLWGAWMLSLAIYFGLMTPLALMGARVAAGFLPAWASSLKYSEAAAMVAAPMLILLCRRWMGNMPGETPLLIVGSGLLAYGVLIWVGRMKAVPAAIALGAAWAFVSIGLALAWGIVIDVLGAPCFDSWWSIIQSR